MGERQAGEGKVWKESGGTDISVARMQIIAEEYCHLSVAKADRFHKATWSHACALFSGTFKRTAPGNVRPGFVVTYICGWTYQYGSFEVTEKRAAVMLFNRFKELCKNAPDPSAEEEAAPAPRRKSRAKARTAATSDGNMAGHIGD